MVAFTHNFILFVWLSWSSGLLQTYPVFLSEGRFVPQSHLAMSRDSFSCYNWGVGVGLVVLTSGGQREARDAAKPPMTQSPTTTIWFKMLAVLLLRDSGYVKCKSAMFSNKNQNACCVYCLLTKV